MTDVLELEIHDGVHHVIMNRPDQMNAINPELHHALDAGLREADRDGSTNAIILSGRGRAFCAGGDVKGFGQDNPFQTKGPRVHSDGKHLVDTFLRIEKPLLAQIDGAAVGLGATIALLCDVLVIEESAKIGDRHVNVGLVAGDGGAALWPLLVGPARAKEMLMRGTLLTGRQAHDMGLVNHCVPDGEAAPTVEKIAAELASLPPYAVRATKVSVNRYLEWMTNLVFDTSLAFEHLSMKMKDHEEAARAWREKRQGHYTGE